MTVIFLYMHLSLAIFYTVRDLHEHNNIHICIACLSLYLRHFSITIEFESRIDENQYEL